MDEKFPEWAKGVVLFCHITSRVPTDPHPDLLTEKGGQGFPHLVFMDGEGNVIAKHQDSRDVAGFRKTEAKAKTYLDLKKKADGGDKAAQFDLLALRLDMGTVDAEAVKAALAGIGGLSKDQQAKLDPLLVLNDFRNVMKGMNRRDPKAGVEAGQKFAEMKKAGRVPDLTFETQYFWICTMDFAESRKDAVLFEEGFNALKEKFGKNPGFQQFSAKQEARLKALKEPAK